MCRHTGVVRGAPGVKALVLIAKHNAAAADEGLACLAVEDFTRFTSFEPTYTNDRV